MLDLRLPSDRLRVLALGAHADDIELGCAGTLMHWLRTIARVEVTWVVCSAGGARADEARSSARSLLRRAAARQVIVGDFTDTLVGADPARLQAFVRALRGGVTPDIVLTHRLEDRHQDHRAVAEATWQAWRDHLILEYEIAKYEGDLGQPNVYVPVRPADARRKFRHLLAHFGSQRSRDWFEAGTFEALMRLRGIECRSPGGHAEAFHARKLRLG